MPAYNTAKTLRKTYDKAVFHYNEILKFNPQNINAHNNLANVLSVQGKLDKAVLHYKEAIKINPEYTKAHYHLGKILMNQKKVQEAIFYFAETIRIRPDYTEGYALYWLNKENIKKPKYFF